MRIGNRDHYELQGEGWERPDAMSQDFQPITTCPGCGEPSEVELRDISGTLMCDACIDDRMEAELKTACKRRAGETISTVISRSNAILTKYGIDLKDTHFDWCSRCQKPTEHYLDGFTHQDRCAICD